MAKIQNIHKHTDHNGGLHDRLHLGEGKLCHKHYQTNLAYRDLYQVPHIREETHGHNNIILYRHRIDELIH